MNLKKLLKEAEAQKAFPNFQANVEKLDRIEPKVEQVRKDPMKLAYFLGVLTGKLKMQGKITIDDFVKAVEDSMNPFHKEEK